MTEPEWQTGTNPQPMLAFLKGKASDRKWRLFACGCYRLLPEEYTSDSLAEVCAAVEGHADERITLGEVNRMRQGRPRYFFMTEALRTEARIRDLLLPARRLLCQSAQEWVPLVVRLRWTAAFGAERPEVAESIRRQERCDREAVARLVADLFGNPFRPVAADPSWLTFTVRALAEGVYKDRAFDRLPILADALQDAGCEDPDILAHCRSVQPHARGCWVIDLLLGMK